MAVSALLYRLLMLECALLVTNVQLSDTQETGADFLHISPNRLQHFQLEPLSLQCAEGLLRSRLISNTDMTPECDAFNKTSSGTSCTFDRVFPTDSGEYWCETDGGQRSNSVNITVTAGAVILDSPVLPVMEGDNVTLSCRSKFPISNLRADFYRDDVLVRSSPAGEMTIHRVWRSDEGLYSCSVAGVGASAASWLAVRADSVVLDSPALPVMEGSYVTLSCRRKKTTSLNLTADFYKDGLLIGSRSSGEMSLHSVSKCDEGLYKCRMSGAAESAESWLAVRALGSAACPVSGQTFFVLLVLRTVSTVLLLPLLLLLVGLLHCGKLTVTHKQRN